MTITTPVAAEGGRRLRQSQTPRKEKPSQLPFAVLLLILVVAFGYYLVEILHLPRMGLQWAIGMALGLTLQRARICFTAALRDPILTGGTNLTKALVIGLTVGTLGFAAIQMGGYFKAGQMADAIKLSSVDPVGLHTVVGGILFGIGAVIAGGCASGTLMRMGEGFAQQWIVFPFFVAGSAIGAASWPVWKSALLVDMTDTVYLPEALGGFVPGLAVQFSLLFGVWLLADWWGRRKTGAS